MIPQPVKAMLHGTRTILILALLLSLLLAGCEANPELPVDTSQPTPAGGTPSPAAPQPGATNTPQPEPSATQPVSAAQGIDLATLRGTVVDYWHPWQGELAQRAQDAVKEFNGSNEWGIIVKAKSLYSAGALYDAVQDAVKAGDGSLPDVVAAAPEQLSGWAAGSSPTVVDLAPYIADAQFGLSAEEVADFNPGFWSQDQAGAVQFGLPALRSANVIFYNQTWAKEMGFPNPPKTPDEFKAQSCEASRRNNTARNADLYGTGGWIADADALATLSWLSAFNANVIPGSDGLAYTFQTAEAEKTLAFLRGMMDNACIWLAKNPEPYEYFSRRMALFYSGTLDDMALQARWQERAKSTDAWIILPYPSLDGKPVVYSSGYSYSVLRSTPKDQLAGWLFARWMSKAHISAALAEALPGIPVSKSAAAQLADKNGTFPWNQILPLTEQARPAPGLSSWRLVRRLLADAAWQVYHLPPDGLPTILPQLDQAVQEFSKKSP